MEMDTSSERRIYGFIYLPEIDTYEPHYLWEACTDLAMRAYGVDSDQGIDEFNNIEVLACADQSPDCDMSLGSVSLVGRPRAILNHLIAQSNNPIVTRHQENDLCPEVELLMHRIASVVLGIGSKEYAETWLRFIALGLGLNEQHWVAEMRTALQAVPPGTTLWVDSHTGNVVQHGSIFDMDTRCGPYPL